LEFLSFFREHNNSTEEGGTTVMPMPASTFYVVPAACEYCYAAHTSQCGKDCQRPRLYFQKRRPPFCKADANVWHPKTDYALRTTSLKPTLSSDVVAAVGKQQQEPTGSSWVAGLFGTISPTIKNVASV
jgi:hypothetical protein